MNDFWHNRWVETLGWTLVHSLWEFALVAVAVAFFMAMLRRSRANTRYLVACAGLMVMVALGVGTFARLLPPPPEGVAAADGLTMRGSEVAKGPLRDNAVS